MAGKNVGNSTVTKADIVEKVYQKIGFSKKEASELVEMVFGTLKDVLENGEKVKISGVGNLLKSASAHLAITVLGCFFSPSPFH